jgi:hypothetical protein
VIYNGKKPTLMGYHGIIWIPWDIHGILINGTLWYDSFDELCWDITTNIIHGIIGITQMHGR